MTQILADFRSSGSSDFWHAFVRNLYKAVSRARFETWLARLGLRSVDDETLELVAPNAFTKDWVQRHYLESIGQAARDVDGAERVVRVLQAADLDLVEKDHLASMEMFLQGEASVLDQEEERMAGEATGSATASESARSETGGFGSASGFEVAVRAEGAGHEAQGLSQKEPFWSEVGLPKIALEGATGSGATEPGASGLEDKAKTKTPSRVVQVESYNKHSLDFFHDNSDFCLNDSYTFENFVVGPSNQLSCAAAKAVVDAPGGNYNPLFLHGASGLGKTHLLQAICHAVLRGRTPRKILYLCCENFVNQFIAAVTTGDLEPFRFKYRKVDMLLIDDVQFLEGKTRTQEEFFHTFNTLHNSGRQIVLTSDRSPKEIPTLQERLISRMRWGMVMKIEPPCIETRTAIVKRKARLRGFELDPQVAHCIADLIDTNIRELEGAVTKVIGFANLMARRIDLDLVHEALRDLIPRRTQVTIQDILELVSREYGVLPQNLQSKTRVKSVVRPRQVGMYLARQHTGLSLDEIGGFFGGRDHSTVLHSVNKVTDLIKAEEGLADKVERLSTVLIRGSGG